jgi:thiol-disulfide isomerase/thioredoxin
MKLFICALLLSLSSLPVHAQAPTAAEASAGAQALMQRLFAEKTTEVELLELTKEANKIGVPRQQIIEAKLVWGLRHQNTAYLVKILPEIEILATSFDSASSAALPDVDAVKAFIAYIKALKAGDAKDEASFKQNILEALWLNPQQAPVFLQSIEKFRRETKMAVLVADLKIPLTTSMGEATTLHDVLGGKKALLLDFWASWCGPCMQLMPELPKKAELLAAHGIVVATVNKDDANAESTAEGVRQQLNTSMPWLVEPAERPYTKAFDLATIPRMVLITPEGKVLFNGHPEDPALWIALKKLDPTVVEPVK